MDIHVVNHLQLITDPVNVQRISGALVIEDDLISDMNSDSRTGIGLLETWPLLQSSNQPVQVTTSRIFIDMIWEQSMHRRIAFTEFFPSTWINIDY